MGEQLPVPLDPSQLRKIESIHRGFLYQHLYAVGCLLLAGENSANLIRVEHDEDIEVCFPDAVVYLQVKTRANMLSAGDVRESLGRFNTIRALHQKGERAGNAVLIIVSNVPPGGALADRYGQAEWPSDVLILSPGASAEIPFALPPAWETLAAALAWCVERAEALPFRLLNSQTLVWKLAAVVQWVCTGQSSQSHTFSRDRLHELFEQVVIHLQSFPPEPSIYREHVEEPAYVSTLPARLIVGHSGSGKSVWASRLAAHSPDPTIYFDAALVENASVTSSLARELAGSLVTEAGGEPQGLFLPGASGYETLVALNNYVAKRALSPIVVIDNAHGISPAVLVRIKEVATGFRWVIICQPSPNQVELSALLNLTPEHIRAWTLTSVAAEFEDADCHLTPDSAQRVVDFTGGVPLFVRGMAIICKNSYACNIEKALQDMEGDLTLTATAQEVISARIYGSLSVQARKAAAIMSISPLPHSREVLFKLIGGLVGEAGGEAAAVRELMSSGIAQVRAGGNIGLHDAFIHFCSRDLSALMPGRIEEALRRFRDLYGPPWDSTTLARITPYFRVLAGLGDYKSIIDICGAKAEILYELGLAPVVRELLYQALGKTKDPEDLFYLQDTLCFWSIQAEDAIEARRLLGEMDKTLQTDSLGPKEYLAFYLKKMALDGQRNLGEASKSYEAALALTVEPLSRLILRYNFACLLLKHKQYKQAALDAMAIAMEYFDRIGLNPDDVFGKNPPEIYAKIKGKEYDIDDFKRLADSLNLYSMCCIAQREAYGIARIHAFKFYTMAYAIRSAIKTGMDVVDDLIRVGDGKGAKDFIEKTLIPTLTDFKVLDYFLPVRAQYAVVLAYCGEFIAARRELAQLAPFHSSAPPEWIEEVEHQTALIEAIEAGEVLLPEPPRQDTFVSNRPERAKRRIGRNEPCPCGSGKKYKKCCEP